MSYRFAFAPFLLGILNIVSFAQNPPMLARPRDRVAGLIDDQQRIVLTGNRHPLAQQKYDKGRVSASFRMSHMILTLKADETQQQALDDLVDAQHNPESSLYHQWITPETYGQMFGVSDNDLEQVTNWLQQHGMTVDEVTPGRRAIVFSGTAEQVLAAFHTQIRNYKVNKESHHANASDPEIPETLASVVGGVVSLHDFRARPLHRPLNRPAPAYTSGSGHYISPSDFATIYNVAPLYQQAINGNGQSVAIAGRININLSDVRLFRSSFGLPANDPQIIVNGTNPGIYDTNEEVEAVLDVEWSGAVARNAAVKFVVSGSTNSSDGVYLSAQYIVSHNIAPVMSMSFGLCEASLGTSGNSFMNSLWQQAAAQGITVFISSGDSGAAGCDSSSATTSTRGLGVNGICSTPYSVCVGGTQFNDTTNASLYWASSNSAGTQASALSYIPEKAWNESGPSGLWASGGGVSTVYTKPSWQVGTGVPADKKRDVPDVSLTAAGHDGYLIFMNGTLGSVGGTSASSPAFAGLMALVVQNAGSRQGNPNATFYALAAKQTAGGTAIYHDTTTGNNTVPGVTGYSATTGYDLATGLGSVDATMLVTHWAEATSVPAFQVAADSNSLPVRAGGSASTNFTCSISGGFNAATTFSMTGLPTGATATFAPSSFAAPGSGRGTLTISASNLPRAGSYQVSIAATSGGTTKTVPLTVIITPAGDFSVGISATALSIAPGKSGLVNLTTSANTGFAAAINLAITGLPGGITAKFSQPSIAAPGSGSSSVTFAAANSTKPGTYSAIITAIGAGVTHPQSLALNVPGFTLTTSPASVALADGAHAAVTITAQAVGGFTSPITLTVSGAPIGVTTTLSPMVNGRRTLTIVRGPTAKIAISNLRVTATAGGITKTGVVTVNATPQATKKVVEVPAKP
jgi:subtilase family serine protease